MEFFTIERDTAAAHNAAEALFASTKNSFSAMLTPDVEMLHIGATSTPGCITKGNLDIVVRVPAARFHDWKQVLSERFANNTGSASISTFTAFEDDSHKVHLGIQIVVIGSDLDFFHKFSEAMRSNPTQSPSTTC